MPPQSIIAEDCLTRWYIDTRLLTSTTSSLPLLETLQPSDQETVKRFYFLADRHMSLASYLLKYLFIHRACHVPWNEVIISRTPEPHRRPCFVPPAGSTQHDGTAFPHVEFNISHQASLVALAGCIIPSSRIVTVSSSSASPLPLPSPTAAFVQPDPSCAPIPIVPQVGIDITCVDERPRRRQGKPGPTTPAELSDFVDIYEQVFSQRELDTIKAIPERSSDHDAATADHGLEEVIKSRVRLFYAYWALKEAYIKMTGEALFAPWLQQLEFTNVVAPDPIVVPASMLHSQSSAAAVSDIVSTAGSVYSEPYTGVQTWLYDRKVEDVRIEIVALGENYLIATAARGAGLGVGSRTADGADLWKQLESINIDRDIAPCALGHCSCLNM